MASWTAMFVQGGMAETGPGVCVAGKAAAAAVEEGAGGFKTLVAGGSVGPGKPAVGNTVGVLPVEQAPNKSVQNRQACKNFIS